MGSVELAIDLHEVLKNLVVLGLDETYVRSQLSGLPEEAWLDEVAALITESEAALILPQDTPLAAALFELTDALRQVGLRVTCGQSADGSLAFTLQGAQPRTFRVKPEPGATVLGLVRAVASVLPRACQVLIANDALPAVRGDGASAHACNLVVLERGTFVALRAAIGDGGLERWFERAGGPNKGSGVEISTSSEPLAPIDFAERYRTRLAQLDRGHPEEDEIVERIANYDPRVPWPSERQRPPGDDFFEYCAGLTNGSLARCLDAEDPAALANLLYRFALATCVGAHYDVAAARQNPGRSAQGVLGLGQLTWSWFIFDALGATDEAAISGKLLDQDWVRLQERGTLSQRQRAYFDLGVFLRSGRSGPALGRLFPLVALAKREGFEDPAQLDAALATHSEMVSEPLTSHPLYYLWPATIYALARRSNALSLLPKRDPFLARPLTIDDVDLKDRLVVSLTRQLQRFSLLDEERFAPLLDPLPVIIDVWITEVDEQNAHGRTMLAAREDAEHRVVAPRAGRAMRPGEIWMFEVQGAEAEQASAEFDDLGQVSYNVARPTGEWVGLAE